MIPKFKMFSKPFLLILENETEMSKSEITQKISDFFNLSEEDRKEVTSSNLNKVSDRVSWTIYYMKKAGMIIRTKKGYYSITDLGKYVLAQNYEVIDNWVLGKYSEDFSKFQYIPKGQFGSHKLENK